MKRKRWFGPALAALVVLALAAACGPKEREPSQPRSTAAVEILTGDSFYLRYTSTWVFSDQRPTEFVEIRDGSLRLQQYDGDDGEPITTITENGISKVYISGELSQEIPLPQTDSGAPAQLRYTGQTGTLTLEETALSFEQYTCSYNGTEFPLSFLFLGDGDDLWGLQYGEDGRYIRILELRGDIPAGYEALYQLDSSPDSAGAAEEEPSAEDPGPPVHLRVLPADRLSDEITADIRLFREQLAGSRHPDEEYFYLWVVDENGEPVANLHCFPYGVNWFIRNEYDVRIGLSRNSGLLPISAADVADADPVILYLCNEDTETISYIEKPSITQEVEIDGERLEQIKAGGVLQVVWTEEKPIDTVTAVDYITVTVTDSDGQPAANRVVYIHMPASQVGAFPDRGDVWFVDVPYRPRYTDENGIARFVREDTFGSTPGGEREIVVLPCYGDFDASLKKAVHIDVPSAPPWEFEITLD